VVADGRPLREGARRFGVSVSAVQRHIARQQETGAVVRTPIPGGPRKIDREQDAILLARLHAEPDATALEHGAWWAESQGQVVTEVAMWRAMHRLGWTQKKVTGSQRTRRGDAHGLAGAGRPARSRAARLCRRKRHPHQPDPPLRLGTA
jgi:transposase